MPYRLERGKDFEELRFLRGAAFEIPVERRAECAGVVAQH